MSERPSTELRCRGPGSRHGRTCETRVALVSRPMIWVGVINGWPLAAKLSRNGSALEAKACPRCKRINLFQLENGSNV